MKSALASWLICILATLSFAEDVIPIAQQRELFVDHHLIASLENVRVELQHPQPQGVAIHFDKPWEGRYCGYVTVFKDDDRYRMYYRGLPEAGKDGSDLEVTCYAESADGIQWEKPNLGLFEVMGARDNNVVLADAAPFSHNFAPFKDTRNGVPAEEQYKAMAGTSSTGLHSFVSADGLNWIKRDQAISKGAFDSQNVAFWSESEQLYICYFRTWTQGEFAGFRSISRATSPDSVQWSEPQAMTYGDTPLEHLYTNQTSPYYRAPHIYIGLAARFMPGRKVISAKDVGLIGVEQAYSADCSDGVLLTTRGGSTYDRTFMEGFITPGIGAEHWTSRSNYAANGVVPLDDETMAIYVQQRYGQPTAYLRQFTLRTDGFAALVAPYQGGVVTTKVFTFSGNRLTLNAATSAAGGIKVAMLDAAGQALPGFSLDESNEIIGNDLDFACSWTSGAKLSEYAGTPVRLQIRMQDARLYSLQFTNLTGTN